ncbi:unnamed protein product [Pylaiella littoralis]
MSPAARAGSSPNGSPKPKHGEPSALQAAAQREIAAARGVGAVDASTGVAVGHVSNYLSLRLDRPLEGCQLRPRVYVYSKLMTTTGVANKAYSNTDHRFLYTWSRGPERQVCANASCPRANSFSPLEWSKWALQGTRIQCVPCHKLRVPRHRSVFCNVTCFKEAWKSHQLHHEHVRRQQALAVGKDPSAAGSVGGEFSLSPKKVLGAGGGGLGGGGGGEDELKPEEEDDVPINAMVIDEEEEWTKISTDGLYTPGEADVGHCLKLECRAVLPTGEEVCTPRMITTEPVLSTPPLPPRRSLVTVKGVGSGGGVRFRLCSYNLLAEIYATQQAYPYCDFWALSWAYRKTNLLRELLEAGADVLCLQEVQSDAYQQFFQPNLAGKGYDGMYKAKTREGAMGKVDGCAIFWRRAKFRLTENYTVEFNECARRAVSAMPGLPQEEGHHFLMRVSKDNVAQVAVLEVLQRPRGRQVPPAAAQLVVANTHLYSNPELPDVKLWQCNALLQELEGFVHSRQLPLLVCGDFNSDVRSAVYELMSTQGVSPDHPDLSNDPCNVLPDASELTHNMQLQSAYRAVMGAEPPYTNYTGNFKGVLDYVWFSSPHIRPLAVAPVPTAEEIMKCGIALPNVQSSSDHIMLLCDIQLGGGSGQAQPPASPIFQAQQQKQYYPK